MNERQKLVHLHTSGTTQPTAQMLNLGEIAVQHASEESCLFIKDNDGNLIKFIASGEIKTMVDNVSIDCGFYGLEPQHEYVDLGLPSGTLWATENIKDANGNELYFAWGETEGYTSGQVGTAKNFNFANYVFGVPPSKYNETDGKTTLDAEDDAATVNWGSSWKMPTKEQFEELIANTEYEWTEIDGIQGAKFTSKVEGYTDKFLFFPAVGSAVGDGVYSTGESGVCWVVSLHDMTANSAWCFLFDSDSHKVTNGTRYIGNSVRPVRI